MAEANAFLREYEDGRLAVFHGHSALGRYDRHGRLATVPARGREAA